MGNNIYIIYENDNRFENKGATKNNIIAVFDNLEEATFYQTNYIYKHQYNVSIEEVPLHSRVEYDINGKKIPYSKEQAEKDFLRDIAKIALKYKGILTGQEVIELTKDL